MDQALYEQLQQWHEDGHYRRIVDAITALPPQARDDELESQLARALNNLGQYEQAIDILQRIAPRCTDDAAWHFRMGYARYYRKEYAQAQDCFARVLELTPDDTKARFLLGECRHALRRRNDPSVHILHNTCIPSKPHSFVPVNDIPAD